MSFKQTIRDLNSLKISGADDIALAALESLRKIIKETRTTDVKRLKRNLDRAKDILLKARRSEPVMQNALHYVLHDLDSTNVVSLAAKLSHRIDHVKHYLKEANKKIIDMSKQKIKEGMVVFVHGYSSDVMDVLKAAKKDGKSFTIHNTENRPLQEGRKTAIECAKLGLPVKHFADSATRLALRKADMMFMGAGAITSEGKVINTMGAELAAEIANRYDVPVYVCANAWKLHPSLSFEFEELVETRHATEMWKNPPKQVVVSNLAFEQIDPELVSGIITELGIFKPAVVVEEVKNKYPWIL